MATLLHFPTERATRTGPNRRSRRDLLSGLLHGLTLLIVLASAGLAFAEVLDVLTERLAELATPGPSDYLTH